jgi:hypothetical protein
MFVNLASFWQRAARLDSIVGACGRGSSAPESSAGTESNNPFENEDPMFAWLIALFSGYNVASGFVDTSGYSATTADD